jgi:hypothetical protein
VIAASEGGALETIVEGVTGCFWSGGSDELAETVLSFDADGIDPADCVANARRFDSEVFRRELPRAIEAAMQEERPEMRLRPPRRVRFARAPFGGPPLRQRGG